MSDNALSIWSYGFTEIYNNVVDHSGSDTVWIEVEKTALTTNVVILDRGIGIFTKIKTALDLLDERHAVLELTKGKLTTDPASHTGEGIFFTSRMFDMFSILSGEVFLSHSYGEGSLKLLPFRFEIQCSAATALRKIEPLPVTPASGRRSAGPLPRESSLSCSPPSSSISEAPRPRSPGYLRSCRSLARRTTGSESPSSGRACLFTSTYSRIRNSPGFDRKYFGHSVRRAC